jgi:hypothetical protein
LLVVDGDSADFLVIAGGGSVAAKKTFRQVLVEAAVREVIENLPHRH